MRVSVEDGIKGADPMWQQAGHSRDWRRHVPDDVRAKWPTLTEGERRAVIIPANEKAHAEDWELD